MRGPRGLPIGTENSAIIGILNEFYPNTGEGVRRCAYNLEEEVASFTSISGEVFKIGIGVGPLPLDGRLPEIITALCVG